MLLRRKNMLKFKFVSVEPMQSTNAKNKINSVVII